MDGEKQQREKGEGKQSHIYIFENSKFKHVAVISQLTKDSMDFFFPFKKANNKRFLLYKIMNTYFFQLFKGFQLYTQTSKCETQKQAVIVGVLSRGKGCARKNSPGIYTRVKKYLQWIKSITEKKGKCYKENDPGKNVIR